MLYEGGTFDPTCGTYTGGTCVTAEQSPSSNKTISTSVTAGQTYYLLLDQWGPPSCGPFINLTISAPPPPTPQIINVATLPYSSGPGSTCTSQNWFSHTNTPVCGNPTYYDGKDILWRFQPNASGVVTIEYLETMP
ncbi:MAG: hypothetical protein N2253_02155 [Bacteroidia bacterium]|nr:hypothetical protein [Bacteroidia bacterium]MCX7763681.1 hypothetical protein [Bacteroidia bacterium]MDW8057038.1 hypothetical protein [Bacteroidia bacterium]